MRLRAIRNAGIMLAIVVTIGCDRVTKHVAMTTLAGVPSQSFLADTVRVVYAENAGGFLGAGADMHPTARTLLFTVLTGLCLAAIAIGALMRRWNAVAALGLALFLAGGASNWYDRVARGRVVDFLNVGLGPVRTGIFNAADVAIMLGGMLFVFGEMRRK
jgi:signal peptidase II